MATAAGLLLVAVILAASGRLGPEAAAVAADPDSSPGYWELVKIDRTEGKSTDIAVYTVASSVERNFVTTNRPRYRPSGEFTGAQWVCSWTWTPIERVLVPGQKVPFVLELNNASKKGDLGINHAQGYVRINRRKDNSAEWGSQWQSFVEDADGKGNGIKAGPNPADKGEVAIVSTDDGPLGVYELKGSGVVPMGSKAGEQMAILVWIEHPATQRWIWHYIYEWKPGIPPRDPGPALPPATTDLSAKTGATTGPGTTPPDPGTQPQGGVDCLDPKFVSARASAC